MNLQEIKVTIRPDGKVELQVRGVKGKLCVDLTQEFERYLGGRVVERRECDEFFEQAQHDEEAEKVRVGDED